MSRNELSRDDNEASKNGLLNDNEASKLEMGFKVPESESESKSKSKSDQGFLSSPYYVTLIQKIFAEFCGTFFIIFAGCGSVAVNKLYGGSVTFPGICVTWGLIVMVMIYTLGHTSAHFNPAVTISQFLFFEFPGLEGIAYIASQVLGSYAASGILKLLFDADKKSYFGTLPVGSAAQSVVIEIIISFLLMFVICGVAIDQRGHGNFAGVVVGMTITLNVFVAGPISGASMNPARSLGPAFVMHEYTSIWVYIVGPIVGTIAGAFAYNLLTFTNKPISQLRPSQLLPRPKLRA